MSHSMSTGTRSSAGRGLTPRFLVALLSVLAMLACARISGSRSEKREALQATQTVEAILNEAHGPEVSAAIEEFERVWWSLEAHRDPSVRSEVATGEYLQHYIGSAERYREEPFWIITTSAEVKRLRIISFDPDRFKAVGSVVVTHEKMTPDEKVIATPIRTARCAVYVFTREDERWMLAGQFLTFATPREVARDWDFVPEWHKAILGDLPEGELCAWFEDIY